MKLRGTISLYAGGQGSGCHGPNCGRPKLYGIVRYDYGRGKPTWTAQKMGLSSKSEAKQQLAKLTKNASFTSRYSLVEHDSSHTAKDVANKGRLERWLALGDKLKGKDKQIAEKLGLIKPGATRPGATKPSEGNPKLEDSKFVYHGTTLQNAMRIQQQGLNALSKSAQLKDAYGALPGSKDASGRTYVATDAGVAHNEARNAVHGDDYNVGKKAQGGTPAVVVLDATHPAVMKMRWNEDPEFDEGGAYYSHQSIPKDAVLGVIKINESGKDDGWKDFKQALKQKGWSK